MVGIRCSKVYDINKKAKEVSWEIILSVYERSILKNGE